MRNSYGLGLVKMLAHGTATHSMNALVFPDEKSSGPSGNLPPKLNRRRPLETRMHQ
jgi:hypothetical protein